MTTISIYDHLTGETIVRDLTADELAELDAQAALAESKRIEEEEAQAAKAAAKQAILDKLGLTADEADALLS